MHAQIFNHMFLLQLVLAGGNLTHEGSPLAKQLSETLQKQFPTAQILFPSVEPTVAAALLACNSYHKN